jgi:chemotaxis protein MotB
MTRFQPSANPHRLRASGDRWLFGYADVVTLLLACFASLYASTLAPAAAAAVPEPSPSIPPVQVEAAPVTPVVPAETPSEVTEPAADISLLERDLRALFGTEAAALGLELSTNDRGLVLSVPEAGSFPPGRAELSSAARLVMLSLAGELHGTTDTIRVEGHTDDVPIRTSRFGSNWELSTARATSVVQFLIEEGGVEPERLSAAGYAEYHPRVANDTPANRARNRRVDVVVISK